MTLNGPRRALAGPFRSTPPAPPSVPSGPMRATLPAEAITLRRSRRTEPRTARRSPGPSGRCAGRGQRRRARSCRRPAPGCGDRVEGHEPAVRGDRHVPLPRSPWVPFCPTLARSVRPARRSRTKTSPALLVSPGTRLVALSQKATKRPSAEIAAKKLPPSPGRRPARRSPARSCPCGGRGRRRRWRRWCRPAPGWWHPSQRRRTGRPPRSPRCRCCGCLGRRPAPTLTRSVRPVRRSRTKTSQVPLVSPGTRLLASELKATNRPSAESRGRRSCRRCPGRRPCRRSPARSCRSAGRGRRRRGPCWCRPAPGCWRTRSKATKRPSAESAGVAAGAVGLGAAPRRR